MQKNLSRKQHWENIYKVKDTTKDVSWYQDDPRTSIDLILSTGMDKPDSIIDIGGGDSKLVDKLLDQGFKNIAVLDISSKAIEKAKTRLGEKAKLVTWIETDVLEFDPKAHFDIWHDRATFHFLTKEEEISRYVATARESIKPNGYLIISTFSMSGPTQCSGLDITQYSKDSIKNTFKRGFNYVRSFETTHITPFGTKQNFIFSLFKKRISV